MRVKLTVNNFRSIAKTTNEFEDYIVSLRGKDSDLARESEVRDDNYDPDVPFRQAVKNYAPSLFFSRPTVADASGGAGWSHARQGQGKGKGKGKAKVVESDEDKEDEDDEDEETVSEDEVSEGEE